MTNIDRYRPESREWIVKSVGGRADARSGFEVTFGPFQTAQEANDAKHQLRGAVEELREALRKIIDADRRDAGDGRIVATLAQWAQIRLRELGGQ
jgi:hypothetical protein